MKKAIIILLIIIVICLGVEVYNTNTNKVVEEKKEVEELSEDIIKESLQNYLDIRGTLNNSPSSLISYLFDDADILNEREGTYMKTNISYKDFKDTMLNYMTERQFIETSLNGYSESEFKDVNGVLYVNDTGASGDKWNVESIEKINDNLYKGITTWIFEDLEETKKEVDFEFEIETYNEKCVIASCKSIDE